MVDPIYDLTGEPNLAASFLALSVEKQLEIQAEAERRLGLTYPAYLGHEGDRIVMWVVRQINFMEIHGSTPASLRSSSNNKTGQTTQYRDRFADPAALAGVRAVTGAVTVDWSDPLV